jgi:two-component system, response regulator
VALLDWKLPEMPSSKEQKDVVESYRLDVNSYIAKPVDFGGFASAVGELGLYWLLINQPSQFDG